MRFENLQLIVYSVTYCKEFASRS